MVFFHGIPLKDGFTGGKPRAAGWREGLHMVAPWWLPRLQDLSICPVTSAKMMSLENALPIGFQKRDDFSEWFDQKFFTTGSNLLLCDQNGEAQGVKKVGVPKESKCKVANNSHS